MAPALALAVLSGVLAVGPLPDGTSFDGVSYTFATGGAFGPRGSLHVTANGTVTYSHATEPHTGSGGTITQKAWTVSKEEAAALFRELAAGGLLDLRDADPWAPHTFHLTAGRWQLALSADAVPEKVAAALRPLLAKAHPELWGEKPAPPKAAPVRPVLTKFQYEFAPAITGDAVALAVGRDGSVTYRRQGSTTAGARETVLSAEWRVSVPDAAKLLDALVADGVLALEDTGGGRFPNHAFTAHAGRWRLFVHPKELPADALARLRPLLEKADPAFWKPGPVREVPAALGGAVLAGALGIRPLPGARAPIDSLSFSFGTAGAFDAGGSLHIAKDGKVRYHHSTAPHTGSGGRVTEKSWELAPAERDELFTRLVADGLMDGGEPGLLWGDLQVTSGRWRASLKAQKVPAKALRHLLPLLEKAHPGLWAEKEPLPPAKPVAKAQPEKPAPPPGALWQFNYYFAPKAEGDHVLLYLGRGGEVSYQRYGQVPPVATKTHVQTTWTIPAREAEALLGALAAGGVCDLEVVPRDAFPVHRVEVGTGPWWSTFHTKPLPDKFKALILPLMRKADAEFWK